jgi:hypothetical protein
MRAALNIVFGILLLMMQAAANVAPHTTAEGVVCKCCSCGSKSCTAPQTSPAPAPTPVTAQDVSTKATKVSKAVPLPIPGTVPCQRTASFPTTDSSLRPSGQSLHERFCVLLI